MHHILKHQNNLSMLDTHHNDDGGDDMKHEKSFHTERLLLSIL